MRAALFIALPALLLAGCGRRPVQQEHPVSADGVLPAKDQGVNPRKDQTRPRDRTVKDACLPIPASQVKGRYRGTWKGIWSCPSMKGQAIQGNLTFALSKVSSPNEFLVKGLMDGTVAPSMTFKGDLKGRMGCTALRADMQVSTAVLPGVIYQVVGTMNGGFSVKAGQPHGFRNGTWKAKEDKLKCTASGTWVASYEGP
jgi:hypothetical protein